MTIMLVGYLVMRMKHTTLITHTRRQKGLEFIEAKPTNLDIPKIIGRQFACNNEGNKKLDKRLEGQVVLFSQDT